MRCLVSWRLRNSSETGWVSCRHSPHRAFTFSIIGGHWSHDYPELEYLAIHSRLTITGGSPYSYQVGAAGTVGAAVTASAGGVGAGGYLKFTLFD